MSYMHQIFDPIKHVRYTPSNPQKYLGKYLPIARSSWEGRVCIWLDNNPNILQWCSECAVIKYIDPIEPVKNGRPYIRNYYPDFYAVMKETNGDVKRYLIEVKPKKETKAPRRNKNPKTAMYEQKTWATNQAKWAAANRFCVANDIVFKILTEDQIPGCKR